MSTPVPSSLSIETRVAEWRRPLLWLVCGLLAFETLTGLWVYFGPFGAASQYAVLWHTAAGLLLLVPFAVYQIRHWLLVRHQPVDHLQVLGYAAFLATAVAAVSGVVLTWQALFGRAIGYGWDLVHIVSGFSMAAFLVLHIALVLLRLRRAVPGERGALLRAAQRRFGWATLGICGVLAAATLGCVVVTPAPDLLGEFPKDYSWRFGDNPYAPSLVRTSVQEAKKTIAPRALAESRSCGSAGCHEQIVTEWLPSAHRYASMSKFFQAVQQTMAGNNGADSTRYCAGCHDPVALFSGSKNLYREDLSSYGADEGVTCVACHSIVKTDVKGNANYTLALQDRYLFELGSGSLAKRVSDFLIRSYPRHHRSSFSRPLYKTPEYCGACHKQFIDKEINNVGWVQLQNQYDNWRQSHWNAGPDPKKTITCRECHMRLVSGSTDPAAGDVADYYRTADDDRHRSHRFIGANQFHPRLHDLPGADEQVRLTEEWLRGETPLPEVAAKWAQGPSVPIKIVAPAEAEPGQEVTVKVVVTSNKVGHDFPTGPLDIIQAWIELVATDGDGKVVFESGRVDDRNFIEQGSAIFKAEGIDQNGNLIDKHNLWEMIGVRFRRNLFPGYSDTADFKFLCPQALMQSGVALQEQDLRLTVPPGAAGQRINLKARLRYRKVDQYLINFLVGAKLIEPGITAPITDVSSDETSLTVRSRV